MLPKIRKTASSINNGHGGAQKHWFHQPALINLLYRGGSHVRMKMPLLGQPFELKVISTKLEITHSGWILQKVFRLD
jgi:hypothetical protein